MSVNTDNTIKAHAEHLRKTDENSYNKMMAELAINNETEYFKQTLCRKGNENYNLKYVRLIVADIMIKYLGFTARHFRENVLPELPKLEQAA